MKKKSSKNILLITVRSDIGGGPKALFDQASGLRRNYPHLNIYIAAPAGHHFSDKFKQIGKSFLAIPHRSFSLKTYLCLLIFVFKNKIDIIHSHGLGAGIYSRLLSITGKPIYHSFHGVHHPSKLKSYLKTKINSWLRYFTTNFIVNSTDELISAKKLNLISSKFKLIGNGINLALYEEKKLQNINNFHSSWKKQNNEIILGTLTRFDRQKGNDILIRHFRQLINEIGLHYKLVLAGEGSERNNIEKLIANLSLENNLILVGNVNDSINFLHSLDIYVTSSKGEGNPLSIIEAIATKKPIVASNVIGHKSLLPKECLFELNSSLDFIEKIKNIGKIKNVITLIDKKQFDINDKITELAKLYQIEDPL